MKLESCLDSEFLEDPLQDAVRSRTFASDLPYCLSTAGQDKDGLAEELEHSLEAFVNLAQYPRYTVEIAVMVDSVDWTMRRDVWRAQQVEAED